MIENEKNIPQYVYSINIEQKGTGKNTQITGNLTCTFSEYDLTSDSPFIPTEKSFSVDFNPLIILGDLRSKETPCQYTDQRIYVDKFGKDSLKTYKDKYDYEYGFGIPLHVGNDYRYLELMSYLDKIAFSKELITLKELEEIQSKYNLELNCSIAVEKDDPFYELSRRKNKNAKKKTYVPLEYVFGKTNEYLLQNAYMNKNHCFSYHCCTMVDVIFAILHFVVMHKFNFKVCALCQKTYVQIPNHGQGKYCSRKSPLGLNSYFDEITDKKFKDLDCQESIKIFRQIVRNRKRSKLDYSPDEAQQNTFINEFDKYNNNAKKSPNIKNLTALYSFVKQYKFS